MTGSHGPRVLHASIHQGPASGIANQLSLEQEAARELGIPWTTVAAVREHRSSDVFLAIPRRRSPTAPAHYRNPIGRGARLWELRRDFYKWLHSVEGLYELILLRYTVYDPLLLHFVRSASVPVLTVHHSVERRELASTGSLIGRIKAIADRAIRPQVLGHCKGIVAVTREIAQEQERLVAGHRTPAFVYPNGGPHLGSPVPANLSDIPELLFVATRFSTWHGLDLLLVSIATNKESFTLHIVGRMSPRDAATAQRDPRIVVHGPLPGAAIRTLAGRCWLGISALALFRNGMTQGCPLKVRDYLSMGLPVFGAYDEVFPEDFPFYVKGEPTIDAVLATAHRLRSSSRSQVSAEARPYISKRLLLSSLYSELAQFN